MGNKKLNSTDWVAEAERIFSAKKPAHFTDYRHCEECYEHDKTLRQSSVRTIGLRELGNPGWDPICFSSAEGIKYYLPALIRLSLATLTDAFYLEQLLFHLDTGGKDGDLIESCSPVQRDFVARFLEFLLLHYSSRLEENFCEEDAMRVYETWSSAS